MNSRLGRQIKEVVESLHRGNIEFALIGGLALASHRVIRATQDIDLLIDVDEAETVDKILLDLGYKCLYKSKDAGNYTRADERVDLLYAGRPIARRLLNTAKETSTSFGQLDVVSVEGLIGFKLQAITNNPDRTQDLEDIRALLRENRGTMDRNEIRNVSDCLNGKNYWMSSSMKSTEHTKTAGAVDHIADGEFMDLPAENGSHPYEQLLDLMAVIEELCPEWPERGTFKDDDIFRL